MQYPTNLAEFDQFFPDEAACRRYLEGLRWPEGFVCPFCCASSRPWESHRGFYCQECRRRTSVTAGTIFEGTRKPLRHWFIAAWEIVGHKYGANAANLKRMLGLGSYETAWAWLHKLRRAMVDPARDQLDGIVEVDETYVGGEEPGVRGRYTKKKAIVAMAVEIEDHRRMGRARLQRVPDVRGDTLQRFIKGVVRPGASVLTDGLSSYRSLPAQGYDHVVVNQSSSEEPAHIVMPAVHRIAGLLKRWLLGTYQGAVRPKQLDYYLDEFTFRFNRRHAASRGLLFHRLLQQAVQTGPTRTHQLFRSQG